MKCNIVHAAARRRLQAELGAQVKALKLRILELTSSSTIIVHV